MKLWYFKGKHPNFGDALNEYMWPTLIDPFIWDENDNEIFLGIGSIILDFPKNTKKFVFGSGYGGYWAAPDVHDGTWHIGFVRGPRTAKLLGLPLQAAVCDAALLLRYVDLPAPTAGVGVAFMPHWESIERGSWAEVCALAGIHFIDPRKDVKSIIADILGSQLLITEAMHGAIVADVLRRPWIAVAPMHPLHRAKWYDWAEALGIVLRPAQLFPSTLEEAHLAIRKASGTRLSELSSRKDHWLVLAANQALIRFSASRLLAIARLSPQMSDENRLCEVSERAYLILSQFLLERHANF